MSFLYSQYSFAVYVIDEKLHHNQFLGRVKPIMLNPSKWRKLSTSAQ